MPVDGELQMTCKSSCYSPMCNTLHGIMALVKSLNVNTSLAHVCLGGVSQRQ